MHQRGVKYSTGRRQELLAVGFPPLGLQHYFSDETSKILVAIGISAILVPAILPEQEPSRARSALGWIYLRTIGKGIVDLFESWVITLVLFVCWHFGSLWVAAYAGIALFFGMARASWVLEQGLPNPTQAAPPLRRMLMIYAATFGWVTVLSVLFPLRENELHAEVSDLFKPYLAAAWLNWALGRFPRIVPLRRFLPNG